MRFLSSEWIECTGCSERLSFGVSAMHMYCTENPELEKDAVYDWWKGPDWVPVLRQRAWCIDCNTLTLAERLPSQQEYTAAASIIRMRAESERLGIAPPCQDISDDLIEMPLERLGVLFERLSRRVGRPRCLTCGSVDWMPLDVERGALRPPLRHDSCGSEFKWHGVISGFNGRMPLRMYSYEGSLVCEAWTR